VTVKLTSLLGSKAGYAIGREVVGLEGYVSVSIGSFDNLESSIGSDEPDSDTVNVLALCGSIRNGYRYHTAKAGYILSADGHCKFVDGLIAYLSFLGFGKRILYCICSIAVKLACRKRNVIGILKSSTGSGKSRNVKSRILEFNLGIKHVGGKVISLIVGGSNYSGLRCAAAPNRTGVGLNASLYDTVIPDVTVGVNGDFFGVAVAANTSVGLNARVGAVSLFGYFCGIAVMIYVYVLGNRLVILVKNGIAFSIGYSLSSDNAFAARLTFVFLNISAGRSLDKLLNRLNAVYVVTESRTRNLLIAAILSGTAVNTGVGVLSLFFTGRCLVSGNLVLMRKSGLTCTTVIAGTSVLTGTSLIIPVMYTGCGNLGILIGISAVLTGMSGITLINTSRKSYYAVVRMSLGRNYLSLGRITVLTAVVSGRTKLTALRCARSYGRELPGVTRGITVLA